MTLFEYLAIAFSLVFSFSATRLLGGLPHVVATGRRYGPHLVFVTATLLVTAVGFWNLWNFREAAWTLPRFLLVLTIPGAIHYCACVLVPQQAEMVASWEAYYYDVRPRYFAGLVVVGVVISVNLYTMLGVPILDPIRLPQASVICVGAVGLLSDDRRVHAALALVQLVGLVLAMLALFIQPDFLLQRAAG